MTDPFTEIERDRYGRYLLPDPDNGKKLPWTRATTFAKTVSDTFALTAWGERMVAKGIASRPDLYALAASTAVEDKDTLNRIAKDAKDAAAASAGANLGTALHGFTEAVDRGETPAVPAPWDADIRAYQQTMRQAGLVISRQHIERIVVLPDLRVAGQFDRLLAGADGTLRVGDVKTGKGVEYAWQEIAIQLALYSRAALIWNASRRIYEPMPPVDQDHAVVMHLPAAKARCDLWTVDIAAGWDMVDICARVRAWRIRRDLAKPLAVPPTDAEIGARLMRSTLIKRITKAPTIADLEALWAANAHTWTPELTAEAAARKQTLLATDGA